MNNAVYVFCKCTIDIDKNKRRFPITCIDQEQTKMKEITASACQGLMLAKSLRLTRLMTYECASRLTENVANIHDCLKTYMLKTCLFVLHLRDPSLKQRGDELLPEQWALLIYAQLLKFLLTGRMAILFDIPPDGEDHLTLFHCKHDINQLPDNEELRAACCDQRIDLLIIAGQLHNILRRYCERKHIGIDRIFQDLPPYDRYAGLVT